MGKQEQGRSSRPVQLRLDVTDNNRKVLGGGAVFARTSAPKTTEVYDTYWRFAAERQEVFFRRARGEAPPWSADPIIQEYKFTNAYRASDRVSQYLIRSVIYQGDQAADEVFFRTLLFKLFNRIETWRMLEREFGTIRWAEYSFRQYDRVLSNALASGQRIYSAAYIMPSARIFGHPKKHQNHLKLIERMMHEKVCLRLQELASMQQAFELLRSYPSLGKFLAYQFVIDVNYSSLTNFSEMEFVVPGPGALDGIKKCFSGLGGLNEADVIRLITDRQSDEFRRLGLGFSSLWGRPLQLIDCQNLFCEVDKYARVAHPTVTGHTGRTRIKQRYHVTPKTIDYWYPPKWGLNELINLAGGNASGPSL
jgi:alpha-glutamyl/putrescinyl thymine pyrophosphorylase clade 1